MTHSSKTRVTSKVKPISARKRKYQQEKGNFLKNMRTKRRTRNNE